MKIYSDTLKVGDLLDATRAAGVYMEKCEDIARPRVRSRGWDVLLGRAGSRRPFNSGRLGAGGEGAASWDDWGRFLAVLFDRDPDARAATYHGREDFHAQTKSAYARS